METKGVLWQLDCYLDGTCQPMLLCQTPPSSAGERETITKALCVEIKTGREHSQITVGAKHGDWGKMKLIYF